MSNLENFGTGRSNFEQIPDDATDMEIAFHLGQHLGCPVVPTLIEGRGAEAMAHRYGQLLNYYGYVLSVLSRSREDIANEISERVAREEDEQLLKYDKGSIPEWNKKDIPGTETPWGFALPRLLISYVTDEHGFDENVEPVDAWVAVLDLLDQVIENLDKEDGADEFLVKLAEALVDDGAADPKIILSRTIGAGKLEQENLIRRFGQIITAMEIHAPQLWEAYKSFSSDERAQLGIADFEIENDK